MRNVYKLVRILLLFISVVSLHAESIDECKNDLYYANGIMMKHSERNALKKWRTEATKFLLSKPEIDTKIANVKISYNKSENFDDDIYESFEQLMSNEWGWEQFSAYFRVFLQSHFIQELGNQHGQDLTTQVNSYKESIENGHGVIVIAHSQGNYFTNEAYEQLNNWMKPYFKMMGVATPANHVAGFEAGDTTAPYVKFHNDFIKLVVTGLSSNRDDPNPNHNGTFSVAAHDFYDSYLTAKNTKDEILGFIETKVEEHTTAPSQWETNEELELGTCDYKITVKHRHDPDNITMDTMVYPFSPNKKLYKVNGDWVKASCGGKNIMGIGHDIVDWEKKKKNECFMIDNLQKEKIARSYELINYSGRLSTYGYANSRYSGANVYGLNVYDMSIDKYLGLENISLDTCGEMISLAKKKVRVAEVEAEYIIQKNIADMKLQYPESTVIYKIFYEDGYYDCQSCDNPMGNAMWCAGSVINVRVWLYK